MAPRERYPTAAPFLPSGRSLPELRAAAAACRGCPLYERATQTVFGAGPAGARVVFVGEQPGNEEDRSGEPFVGPAGRLLDKALGEAGIDRGAVYVTNAVKHFKWEERGKRRIHKKPSSREMAACRPWLLAELEAVKPDVIVCLGASAAQQIYGKSFRVTKDRGKLLETPLGVLGLATVHPSAVLRAPDQETRRAERARFVEDLKVVARRLEEPVRRAA